MNELSDNRRDILFRLKTRGAQTASALAGHLGITTVGVRQHLAALADKNYVTQADMDTVSRKRGRPVRPWCLTDKGNRQFPDAHADITVDLIASVRESFGEDALDTLIEKRSRQTLTSYSDAMATAGESLDEQLMVLSALRTSEGYMSEIKSLGDDNWLLIENHCPICAAARACQGFCRSELEIFQTLLQNKARIERINHIIAGARRCAYKVTPIPHS